MAKIVQSLTQPPKEYDQISTKKKNDIITIGQN